MLNTSKSSWFYIASAAFLLLASVGIYFEFFAVLLIPFVILLVYLALFHLNILYFFLIFAVPASVNIADIGLGVGLSIPTDPILVGLLLFVIFKTIYDGGFDKEVLLHPVTILLFIQLGWTLICCFTSSLPVISLKYFTSQIWFIATFYFIATQVFKNLKDVPKLFWLYVIPFSIVIAYTLWQHSRHGFDQKSGNWVMNPFYSDHTSYGAALAFFFPFLLAVTFGKTFRGSIIKPIVFMVLAYFTVALIFSYTRAAWLSLVVGLVVFIILKLKIKWQLIVLVLLFLGGTAKVMEDDIRDYFLKNKVDSSTDLNKHVKSISNVSSDASNKERINRWKSGFEMFKERPLFGWGPGTYSFNYAGFQKESDKTIISTNAGDMGNAHSEYIGPLSEAGLPAFLIVIALFISIISTGVRVYKRAEGVWFFRFYSAICLIGLITYIIHGFLNNFLDTDKITAPFYGMTAILVVMDLYQKGKYPKEKLNEQLEKLTA